jgi:hypothetical protein
MPRHRVYGLRLRRSSQGPQQPRPHWSAQRRSYAMRGQPERQWFMMVHGRQFPVRIQFLFLALRPDGDRPFEMNLHRGGFSMTDKNVPCRSCHHVAFSASSDGRMSRRFLYGARAGSVNCFVDKFREPLFRHNGLMNFVVARNRTPRRPWRLAPSRRIQRGRPTAIMVVCEI